MKREPMESRSSGAALPPSARLAASHDALAHYLRGGATTNARAEGASAPAVDQEAAARPADAPSIDTNLALALANKALAPLARRHPWALVGGAAVVGALLAAHPWRTVLRPALVAGMVSPVLTRWASRALVNGLTHRLLGPDPGPPR